MPKEEAVDAAFDPAGMTAAFVVTHKGRIIAERYGEHITPTTPSRFTATLGSGGPKIRAVTTNGSVVVRRQ